ncbi:MAG: hypothetical protein KAV87_19480 [Desulfobacteraceae bacterium]|nr:hypothetical protein [Desulfobacteraceae bacterium]
MRFIPGHYYQHEGSSRLLAIRGVIWTDMYGFTLIAEEPTGNLCPVGMDEDAAQGWKMTNHWNWERNVMQSEAKGPGTPINPEQEGPTDAIPKGG